MPTQLSETPFQCVLEKMWAKLERTPMEKRKRQDHIECHMFWHEALLPEAIGASMDHSGSSTSWKHDAQLNVYNAWCESFFLYFHSWARQ